MMRNYKVWQIWSVNILRIDCLDTVFIKIKVIKGWYMRQFGSELMRVITEAARGGQGHVDH